MTDKPTVGFIGVGLMGWGMAKNIVEKGYPLRVMAHRKREAVDDLIGRGAVEVADAAEMAAQCQVIVMCVTGTPQVEANIAEIVKTAQPGLTIIDTSTAEPDSTRRLAAELAEKDITLIDAPLSRTPTHAWDGELTTYVGGPLELIEQWRPLFETWANVIIPVNGPVGTAHAVKLVNNVVAIGYAALWSECYATLSKLDVEPTVLREVISNSGMNCGNFQTYSKYVCEGDPNAHKFALANCLKDISYYHKMADELGVKQLMSSGALETVRQGVELGLGERYMTQMVDVVRTLNGDKPLQ